VIYLHSPFLAIGIELPKAYVKKHWKTIAFLLGPVMVYGWFVSAAIIYGIIPGVSFLSALGMLDLPPLFVHGR
jgi:NhaP-type Na+/H+ or K+/H+ antiporter